MHGGKQDRRFKTEATGEQAVLVFQYSELDMIHVITADALYSILADNSAETDRVAALLRGRLRALYPRSPPPRQSPTALRQSRSSPPAARLRLGRKTT